MSSPSYIDASASPYNVTPTGDSTSGAQAAINAAFTSGPPRVVFPTGFNFTTLATYPGVELIFNGDNAPVVRTAAGSGLYTTDAIGNAYPVNPVFGVVIRNLSINDGTGLKGANLTICDAQRFHLENVNSRSALAGAEFTGSMNGGNVLTVSSVTNGTICAGMMIQGLGCMTTQGINAFPIIASGSGTSWNLTGYSPTVSGEMIGLVSWTWSAAPGNIALPSAAILYVGATFDGLMTNGYAGGWFDPTALTVQSYAGAGLMLLTTRQDGTDKPNHNTFVQLYTPCANLGIGIVNGADNTIVNADQQFCNYGILIGTGLHGADRNVIINPYFEGGPGAQTMRVGFGLDVAATNNRLIGSGSLDSVTTSLVDNGMRNSWENLEIGQIEYAGIGKFLTSNLSTLPAGNPPYIPPGVYGTSGGFWALPQTVHQLPSPTASLKGMFACVTDATTNSFGYAVNGGGSFSTMVWCNGSAWVVF